MSELIADFSLSYSIFDIIVGVAMILSSILCLFLNFIIIRAVTQDIELYKLNSYKFMLGLAWADVIQSLLHSITGFCTIFQTTWYPWFNKAMGVLCTPSYVFYATTTIVLSINRLVVITSPRAERWLFSKTGVKLWFLLLFAISTFFLVANASPWASMLYYPDQWSWSYDYEMPQSHKVQKVAMFVEVGGIFVSGIIYVLIFGFIFHKRNQGHVKKKSTVTDVKILIQAFTITSYCTVLNTMWHNYQWFLPDTKEAYMALNFMWIYNAAVNPLVYFAVNVAIRKKAGSFLKISRGNSKLVEDQSAFLQKYTIFTLTREVLFPEYFFLNKMFKLMT